MSKADPLPFPFHIEKTIPLSSKKGWLSRPLLRLSLLLWGACLLLWLGVMAYFALEVNAWSLAYLHAQVQGSQLQHAAPPLHPRADLWLARQALARGDPALALALVQDQAESGNPQAQVVLGQALADAGQLPAALDAWSQAEAYYALHDAAQTARQSGQPGEALLALRAAYRLDPEKGTAPLAVALWDLDTAGHRDEALTLLSQALSQYPHAGHSQRLVWAVQLGSYLQQLARWDQAEAVYLAALAQVPQAWQAYIGLGWVYYQRGDGLDVALAAFQQVSVIDPARGDGMLAMAQVMVEEQRVAEADALFARALQLDPQQQTWWLAWGNALRSAGDLPRALVIYAQTVEKFPAWAPAYYELAWACQLGGSNPQAIEAIQQALALAEPASDGYYARAGRIYELSGDALQARSAYDQALAINAQNELAQQGLKRLGQK